MSWAIQDVITVVGARSITTSLSAGVSLGEDSELTQLLCESLLVSETQLHPAGEEAALGACGRLRLAVDTLLELLNQANAQVATRGLQSLTDTTPVLHIILEQWAVVMDEINLSHHRTRNRTVIWNHFMNNEQFYNGM